ncbi:MAG: hypothetical protein II332_03235 [Kiritimatiellae bacterium]|nr:hypothetical protein [Kiritimatiellia bacterium]
MLTAEQEHAVRTWAQEGAGLSEIQSRLAEEFDIHMSYMETRFLVMDINASIKDKEVPAPKQPAAPAREEAPASGVVHDIDAESESGVASEAELPMGGAKPVEEGEVSVEISRIQRPGFALCGSLVFPDGEAAEWGITNDGRISMDFTTEGYRPSQEYLRQFQMKLKALIESAY